MKKIIMIFAFAGLVCGGVSAQTIDPAIGRVLAGVEQNNATLAARRSLTDAQMLEARTGNSLENPEVEFGYKWGDPSSLGKAGEVAVTQGFDFPSSYVYRNRVARARAEQYGHEYAAYRQQVLLEAQSLCIEIIALRQQKELLRQAWRDAHNLADMMVRRENAGDANMLEVNKAKFELVGVKNAYKSKEIELEAAELRLTNLNGGIPVSFDEVHFPSAPVLMAQQEMVARYENASPELLAMLSEKSAADNDVRLSRSMSLPKLSAGYKHEYTPGGNEKFNGVTVGMSIPMFGNRNNVKRAKAQAQYADAQYRSGVVDTRAEIAKLYAEARLLVESLGEYREIREHTKSIELLNKAIEAGQISVVDYFAELQPIYDAYLTMVETERDYHLVCARINMIGL